MVGASSGSVIPGYMMQHFCDVPRDDGTGGVNSVSQDCMRLALTPLFLGGVFCAGLVCVLLFLERRTLRRREELRGRALSAGGESQTVVDEAPLVAQPLLSV